MTKQTKEQAVELCDCGCGPRKYACEDCGVLRTKCEGGTTFTVCNTCWDKYYSKLRSKLNEGER